MQPSEQNLLAALRDLDSAVKSMRTADPKPNLLPLFSRIDEIAAGLAGQTDPQLIHFIQRKSYEKALLWLEENSASIVPGRCGH